MWKFLAKALESGQIITGVLALITVIWFSKLPGETVGLITEDAWSKLHDTDGYLYLSGWAFCLIFFVLWLLALKKISKLASSEQKQLEAQL